MPCTTKLTGTAIRYKSLSSASFREEIAETESRKAKSPEAAATEADPITLYAKLFAHHMNDVRSGITFYRALDSISQRALSSHVLKTKGLSSEFSWKFQIDKKLPEEERLFVAWFVREFTQYKP